MNLPYKYSNIVIGVLIIFVIPIIFFSFSKDNVGLISTLLLSCVLNYRIIRKYGNTLSIAESKIIIRNILSPKKEVSKTDVNRISLYTERGFLKNSISVNIKTDKGIKRFHIGTLSSDKIVLLYDFLHNHVDCPIEIMNNK